MPSLEERHGPTERTSSRTPNFRDRSESIGAALTGECVGLKNGLAPARVVGQ
jgi:hypothetical protein